MLEQFGLAQQVAVDPPSRSWTDVTMTCDDFLLVNLKVPPPALTDHGLVVATIPFLRVHPIHAPATLRTPKHVHFLGRRGVLDPAATGTEALPTL